MSYKAFVAQSRLLRTLIGEKCWKAERYEGDIWSDLSLSFGRQMSPEGDIESDHEKGLMIECPWRLETRDRVLVGTRDDKELINECIQSCVGATVYKTRFFRPSFMAVVRFDNDLRLWLFPEDSKDFRLVSRYHWAPWHFTGHAYEGGWEDTKLRKAFRKA